MPSFPLSAEDACRTLGIKLGSSEAEIKSAYKKLALKTHPDKNPNDSSASRRFLAVSEAYKTLTEEEFSDDDEYDDYDDADEDFDISEIFAFRMFERMFFDAASGGSGSSQGRRSSSGNSNNNRNNAQNGGVQFTFPGMNGGGGCNCPDCRRRFGYEKAKPWREYVPKSQRTDIPKETVKEVDPSIHDNWLSDEDDQPKTSKGTTKPKSKKAQKRENAAKEQKAQAERLERENKSKELHDQHQHQHNYHHSQHETSAEESHMHMNKVNKLKLKQEEMKMKLEQERANKAAAKKKGSDTSLNQKGSKHKDSDTSKHNQKVDVTSDHDENDEDDDSDLDIEEMASRMGITDGNTAKVAGSKSVSKSNTTTSGKSSPRDGNTAEFTTTSTNNNHKYKEQIAVLQEMGFEYAKCLHAIETSLGSVELAATMLLQSEIPEESSSTPPASNPAPSRVVHGKRSLPNSVPVSTNVKKSQPSTSHTTFATKSSLSNPSSIAPGLSPSTTNSVPNVAKPLPKSISAQSLSSSMPVKPVHTTNAMPNLTHMPSYLNVSSRAPPLVPSSTNSRQSTPPIPPGLVGNGSTINSSQIPQLQQPSIFTQQESQLPMNNVLSNNFSFEDNSGDALKNNAQNFDFFNNHPSSSSHSSHESLINQAMPMPVQNQQKQQQVQHQQHINEQHIQQAPVSSNGSSSKFFSLFAPQENGNTEESSNDDPLGLGTTSLSDLLLNNDSNLPIGDNMLNEGTPYTSIFDNVLGNDNSENDGINMSGLGLNMSGLGGENSSSASLSSLLGGSEQNHQVDQQHDISHQNSDQDVMGLFTDMSSLIGSDDNMALNMDNVLGNSFLLDTEPVINNAAVDSNSNHVMPLAPSLNTAASIVKNGGSNRINHFTTSPPRAVPINAPSPGPSSPVTSSSSGTSSTKCLYFFTPRGCRHGVNCKFSHTTIAPLLSTSSSGDGSHMNSRSQYNSRSTTNLALSKKPCMFYSTPQGCKHGNLCRFVHGTKHK